MPGPSGLFPASIGQAAAWECRRFFCIPAAGVCSGPCADGCRRSSPPMAPGGIKKLVGLLQRVVFSAQDKTRTCTNVIVHYPLKVACLPISPPGRHCRISHFGCANIEFIFESAKFSGALCRKNDFFLPAARLRGSRKAGGRPPQGGLGRLWRPERGWLRGAAAGPGGWGAVEAGAVGKPSGGREPGFCGGGVAGGTCRGANRRVVGPGFGRRCCSRGGRTALSGGSPGCCCRTAARQEVPHNKKGTVRPDAG